MTVRLVDARPIIHQPEHVLWTLAKTGRFAEARVRLMPIGMDLRFFLWDADAVRDEAHLLWSKIFRQEDGGTPALHDAALLKRREFEVRGWTLVAKGGARAAPM